MISPNTAYLYLQDLLSKNNGVYISPQEFERYANIASDEMFDDFLGIKTTPRTVYGRSRLIDSRLNPFRVREPSAFVNEYLPKPTGVVHFTAVYTTGAIPIPVKPIDEDRYAKIFSDPLASPNDDDIYYIEEVNRLRLLGDDNLSVWLEYLKRPVRMVYGFTTVNGRPVYNAGTSTPLEWDETMLQELTNRILAKAGLSMDDQLAIQVANNNKAQE